MSNCLYLSPFLRRHRRFSYLPALPSFELIPPTVLSLASLISRAPLFSVFTLARSTAAVARFGPYRGWFTIHYCVLRTNDDCNSLSEFSRISLRLANSWLLEAEYVFADLNITLHENIRKTQTTWYYINHSDKINECKIRQNFFTLCKILIFKLCNIVSESIA